jgi:hypothetical protein
VQEMAENCGKLAHEQRKVGRIATLDWEITPTVGIPVIPAEARIQQAVGRARNQSGFPRSRE